MHRATGQDQMRIVKSKLLEMMPDVRVFLDVDDLKEGRGAEYLDRSMAVLVFCSQGYFVSQNCMRELLRAVTTGVPIIAMLEAQATKGGLTLAQVFDQLTAAGKPCEKNGKRFESMYEMWGLTGEVSSWGYHMPTAQELYDAIFCHEPIEWNRIGPFQDVTLRLTANAVLVLQAGQISASRNNDPRCGMPSTYIQSEMANLKPSVEPPASDSYNAYCSPHNLGAMALMQEVAEALELDLKITGDVSQQTACHHMIVYLNEQTWTRGEESAAFAMEVEQAMKAGTHLILCHEMMGVGQEGRHACDFGAFFECSLGTTPQELLKLGIYHEIAQPLRGGAWRNVSLVMVALAVAERGTQDEVVGSETVEGSRSVSAANSEAHTPPAMSFFAQLKARFGSSRRMKVDPSAAQVGAAEVSPATGHIHRQSIVHRFKPLAETGPQENSKATGSSGALERARAARRKTPGWQIGRRTPQSARRFLLERPVVKLLTCGTGSGAGGALASSSELSEEDLAESQMMHARV